MANQPSTLYKEAKASKKKGGQQEEDGRRDKKEGKKETRRRGGAKQRRRRREQEKEAEKQNKRQKKSSELTRRWSPHSNSLFLLQGLYLFPCSAGSPASMRAIFPLRPDNLARSSPKEDDGRSAPPLVTINIWPLGPSSCYIWPCASHNKQYKRRKQAFQATRIGRTRTYLWQLEESLSMLSTKAMETTYLHL
ncbi:hypothetical protein ACLB2K_059788 [Fragaria x ananassa]